MNNPIPNETEPAFPCECTYSDGVIRGNQTGNYSGIAMGLTKREYFAGLAMQGLLANPKLYDGSFPIHAMCAICNEAWQFADVLLAREGLAEIERGAK